jgi:LacI family transcriptional regulator
MAMASLKDVAQAAGVSVTTVSRFLNGTLDLPDRTRTAVEAAILALKYQPNPHARRLSRGRSDTIGLVIPDVATPFFATLVAAVEAEADRRGLGLTLHATLNRREREQSCCDFVLIGLADRMQTLQRRRLAILGPLPPGCCAILMVSQ